MFPSLGVSSSAVSSALAFLTPLGKSSGFLGLGVCFGVEQGARITLSESPLATYSGDSPLITFELFLLYLLVPLSAFLGMVDLIDIYDVKDIMLF